MAYTEGNRLTDWLKGETESPKDFSRLQVTVLAGEEISVGTVLGKVTSGGKYVELNPGASDGSQTAAAISLTAIEAESGVDKLAAVIVRDAIIIRDGLTWPSGISGGQITTALGQLASLGIIEREGV